MVMERGKGGTGRRESGDGSGEGSGVEWRGGEGVREKIEGGREKGEEKCGRVGGGGEEGRRGGGEGEQCVHVCHTWVIVVCSVECQVWCRRSRHHRFCNVFS